MTGGSFLLIWIESDAYLGRNSFLSALQLRAHMVLNFSSQCTTRHTCAWSLFRRGVFPIFWPWLKMTIIFFFVFFGGIFSIFFVLLYKYCPGCHVFFLYTATEISTIYNVYWTFTVLCYGAITVGTLQLTTKIHPLYKFYLWLYLLSLFSSLSIPFFPWCRC